MQRKNKIKKEIELEKSLAYWLFKSEPSTFSIETLSKRPKQTEHWDGVRNFQVRNMLRDEMKVGDLGFFYHSSCKIPGIVGIIKVVKAGYPDFTAFDADSPYYDPRSKPEHPLWFMVDVQLVEIFPKIISLAHLKKFPELENMKILRKGNRLSITPVAKAEWKFITSVMKKA